MSSQKLKAAGYDELVVNVHHFPNRSGTTWPPGLGRSHWHFRRIRGLLETGGGILHARRPGSCPRTSPFLVHNVDIVSNLDLAWVRAQTRPDALATLVVSERETRRYLLFDEDMRLVGWTDNATGEVRSPIPDLDPTGLPPVCLLRHPQPVAPHFPPFEEWGFRGVSPSWTSI